MDWETAARLLTGFALVLANGFFVTTELADAIDRFQEATRELALVFEDGRAIGLVTSTDAFEAIIGELEDPLDVESRDR